MIVKCETCGKVLIENHQKYVSMYIVLKNAMFLLCQQDKKLNGRYSGGKFVPCVICNKKIYRTPCLLKTVNHPACSRKCVVCGKAIT